MNKLENDELIEEYYRDIMDKYPHVTLEQLKQICFTPWKFLKQEMESGDLTEVRFKYFGTFQVYPGRAINMLHNLNDRHKYNKIDPKQYFRLKQMLEAFINKQNENNSLTL